MKNNGINYQRRGGGKERNRWIGDMTEERRKLTMKSISEKRSSIRARKRRGNHNAILRIET